MYVLDGRNKVVARRLYYSLWSSPCVMPSDKRTACVHALSIVRGNYCHESPRSPGTKLCNNLRTLKEHTTSNPPMDYAINVRCGEAGLGVADAARRPGQHHRAPIHISLHV